MKMQKLVLTWTSVSEDTFFNMITPYALTSQEEEQFGEVVVLIWGGSAQTIAKVPEIKLELGIFREKGITVKCCSKCAEQYGIVDELEKMNVDIVNMSHVFNDYMKEGAHILTV